MLSLDSFPSVLLLTAERSDESFNLMTLLLSLLPLKIPSHIIHHNKNENVKRKTYSQGRLLGSTILTPAPGRLNLLYCDYALKIALTPSPQPSPSMGEGGVLSPLAGES